MINTRVDSRIHRLSVYGANRDSAALRLSVTRQLGAVDFTPDNMPPSSILIVRRVTDPLPGGIDPRPDGIRPDMRWQQAVRSQISGQYRAARRPHAGRLMQAEQAVLFRDAGEMLACLCLAICRGEAGGCWWWRRVYGRLDLGRGASSALTAALGAEVHLIPAAVVLLRAWRGLDRFAASLEHPDALHLCGKLLAAYRLPSLESRLFGGPLQAVQANQGNGAGYPPPRPEHNDRAGRPRLSIVRPVVDGGDSSYGAQEAIPARAPAFSSPPWRGLVDDDADLSGQFREAALLIALACLIQERPAVVRQEVFQQAVGEWWWSTVPSIDGNKPSPPVPASVAGEALSRLAGEHASGSPGSVQGEQPADSPVRVATGRTGAVERTHGRETSSRGGTQSDNPARRHGGGSDVDEHDTLCASGPAGTEESLAVMQQRDVPGKAGVDASSPPDAMRSTPALEDISVNETENGGGRIDRGGHPFAGYEPEAAEEAPLRYSDEYIDTGLGGVLFLVNLLERLDVPQCFDTEWNLSGQLDRWTLLELTARVLLGRQLEKVSGDRLWALLAKLGGRKRGSPIGRGFRGGTDYMVPVHWLKAVPAGAEDFQWAAGRRRVRLWCSRFILAEIPLKDNELPRTCLERLAEHYRLAAGGLRSSPSRYADAPKQPFNALTCVDKRSDLARWTALATPFIRAYLRSLLQLESAAGSSLLKNIFGLPARIYFTRSHIDLVTDINNSRLDLRRRGLDQDPGWCPDYGRVVLFHYS